MVVQDNNWFQENVLHKARISNYIGFESGIKV